MADLRGVLIGPENLSGSTYHAAPFPQFKEDDASPIGKYRWVFLTQDQMREDKKELKLRPTGNNDSGPYFHSVLSGNYGVRRASRARIRYSSNKYEGAINLCNWSREYSEQSSPYYGEIKHIERMYCDGKTVVSYEIMCNEPGAYYYTASCWFKAWSVVGVGTLPDRNYFRLPYWQYEAPWRTVHFSTMAEYKRRFDYYLWDVLSGLRTGHFDPQLNRGTYELFQGEGEPLVLSSGDLSYDYGELSAFEWWDLTGVLEGRYRALAGQAYYNAATSLPKDACNSIANVLEAAASVNDLLHGDIGKLLPSNPKDAWLFYRYQYNTTKLDIEEYRSLTDRLNKLVNLPTLRSDGSASYGNLRCHCEITVDPTYMIPGSTKEWLSLYGFKLSAVNVWDMIPYSFVVDWFFSIGSFLEILEDENWAYELPITEAWTSFSSHGPGTQSTYFRVPGYFRAACPFLDYSQRGASNKTIVKRILDSIALFT